MSADPIVPAASSTSGLQTDLSSCQADDGPVCGVAYLRSRPAEPEFSARALELQRAAVKNYTKQHSIKLAAVFIEEEGDDPDALRPAYYAAERAAAGLAAKHSSHLLIVSRAAIGDGKPFISEPEVPQEVFADLPPRPGIMGADGIMRYGTVISHEMLRPLDPAPAEIVVPTDAPTTVCLLGVHRPDQLETRVYICNSGSAPLLNVHLYIDDISMARYYGHPGMEPEERWANSTTFVQKRWAHLEPGQGVHVADISHWFWDIVVRYVLRFTDTQGKRNTLYADDAGLDRSNPTPQLDRIWSTFDPPRPMDLVSVPDDDATDATPNDVLPTPPDEV